MSPKYQNPCDDCILKNNCTSICSRKRDYTRLLSLAFNINTSKQKYIKYNSLYSQSIREQMDIIYRKLTLKRYDNNF